MSLRADTSQLIAGCLVASMYSGHGALGSAIPSSGSSGAALLYNDIALPAEANDEFRALLLTAPAGTLALYEDSSFVYTGAGGSGTYEGFKNGVSYGVASFTVATNVVPGDTTAPTLAGTISITNNTTGTSYTATAPVGSDNVGVTQYRYSLNGGSTWSVIPLGGRSVNISGRTPLSTDTLLMAAGDAAGLWSSPLSININLPAAPAPPPPPPPPPAPGVRVADPTIIIERGDWGQKSYRMTKQPREVKDVVIEMAPWFLGRADDPASVDFSVSNPEIVPTVTLVGTRINIAVGAGIDGGSYNISVRMTTNSTPAVVREFDLFVDVLEVA